MELFNIIAGIASVASLLISLFTLNKVNNITKKSIKFKVKGDDNQQAGRDIKIND